MEPSSLFSFGVEFGASVPPVFPSLTRSGTVFPSLPSRLVCFFSCVGIDTHRGYQWLFLSFALFGLFFLLIVLELSLLLL